MGIVADAVDNWITGQLDNAGRHMPRKRALVETAAGKLVSTIQKEWGKDLGTAQAEISEHVMDSAHALLQAAHGDRLEEELGDRPVLDYLGALWVKRHPSVLSALHALKAARCNHS